MSVRHRRPAGGIERSAIRIPATVVTCLALACVPIGDDVVPFDFPVALSLIAPVEDTHISPGGTARIQWIDEGVQAGAVLRLEVVSTDETGTESKALILENRDAVADGDADIFDWDGRDALGSMMPARSYRVIGVMDDPSGLGEVRESTASIVIPFDFILTGNGASSGILINNSGGGPFLLRDDRADFIIGGVQVGAQVSLFSGSGAVIGTYTVLSVAETALTLNRDAGDSGGVADVRYVAGAANPVVNDDNATVMITWQDEEFASGSTIRLEADPDTDGANDNASTILDVRSLGPDGIDDQFNWDGNNADAERLSSRTYYIRAVINPGLSSEMSYLSDTRVTVGGVPPTLTLTAPASDTNVPAGGTVTVNWIDTSPDPEATLDLGIDPDSELVDPDHDSGNEQTIESGIEVSDSANTFAWETIGTAEGTYTIFGVITDSASSTATASAPGRVTLANSPPFFEFVRPEHTGDDTGVDVDNNFGIGPFVLTDATATFVSDGVIEGNQVEITGGTDVTTGPYLVAETPTSETQLMLDTDAGDSGGAGDVEYEITGDIEVISGVNRTIPYRASDPEEAALADFVLDFDDDHANLNEIDLARNVAIPNQDDPADADFNWTGTLDADGSLVPPAGYMLFARVRDATNERTVDFDGLVQVITATGEPRMLLTAPATDRTAALGANHEIEILWADEDTDSSTTITLRYDDDPMPDESGETGAAEVTIEAGIDADADTDDDPPPPVNPDRWEWDWHPSDITQPAVGAGDYYIFAYIGNSGDPVADPDQLAVAAGMVTIPNTRPELEFTTPGAADAEFDSDNATNDIAWNQRDPDSADSTITVDLFLDPDDTFDNNNEYRIANNYTGGSPFAWDGTSIDHGDVDTGPYRVVAVIDTPSNNERTVSSDTLVNYRPDTSSAVITLATLFDPQSADNGDAFTITWADLSPAGNETVTLEYDTDSDPSTAGP